MRFVKAFGQFWYDFIVGDDWKIAVSVVCALALLGAVLASGAVGDHVLTVLGGVFIVVLFAISLLIDVRPRRRRGSGDDRGVEL